MIEELDEEGQTPVAEARAARANAQECTATLPFYILCGFGLGGYGLEEAMPGLIAMSVLFYYLRVAEAFASGYGLGCYNCCMFVQCFSSSVVNLPRRRDYSLDSSISSNVKWRLDSLEYWLQLGSNVPFSVYY